MFGFFVINLHAWNNSGLSFLWKILIAVFVSFGGFLVVFFAQIFEFFGENYREKN